MGIQVVLLIVAMFWVIDYYEPVLLAHHRVASLQIRRTWNLFCFSFIHVLKRKYFELSVVLLFCLYSLLFEPELQLCALFILFYAVMSPFLSYTAYFTIVKQIFFSALLVCFVSVPQVIGVILMLFLFYSLYRFKYPHIFKVPFHHPYLEYLSRAPIFGIVVLGIIVLLNRGIIVMFPFEQGVILVLMVLSSQLDSKYRDHKTHLKTCLNAYHLSLLRLDQPRLDFLSHRQKADFIKTTAALSIIFFLLWLVSSYRIDLFVLYLGFLAQIFLSFDVITHHYLLQRSIVYANDLIRVLIDSLLGGAVFSFLVYYSTLKQLQDRIDISWIAFGFRFCFGFVFLSVIVFSFYRLKSKGIRI